MTQETSITNHYSQLQENVNNGSDDDHKDFVMLNGGEIDFWLMRDWTPMKPTPLQKEDLYINNCTPFSKNCACFLSQTPQKSKCTVLIFPSTFFVRRRGV
jgi:hypothetical protein